MPSYLCLLNFSFVVVVMFCFFFFPPRFIPLPLHLIYLFLTLPFFSSGNEKCKQAAISLSSKISFCAKFNRSLENGIFSLKKKLSLLKTKTNPLFQRRGLNLGERSPAAGCFDPSPAAQVGSSPGGGSGVGVAPAGPSPSVPARPDAPCWCCPGAVVEHG